MYEAAVARVFQECGWHVAAFRWGGRFGSFLGKVESKWTLPGPATIRLNRDLINEVATARPDVVLVWRGTHVFPSTLRALKQEGVRTLVSYNHDDFSGPSSGARVPAHHHVLWRRFLACAAEYDLHLVKRADNIEHLRSLGAAQAELFPMYFVPWIHRPMELSAVEAERFETDVVFVGHHEPDGREEYLRALVAAGIKVRLFGGKYWTREVLRDLVEVLGPISPVYGDDYAKALCGGRLCLAFLSSLNRDTYTRRCVEIPACGRPLVCWRTSHLQALFREDEEAVLFSSKEELLEKVSWLLRDDEARQRIAKAGMERVWKDGHDVLTCVERLARRLSRS